MPDCSRGLKSRITSSGGVRANRERCRNCEMLAARIQDAKQQLREVKRELRRKVRELDNKREKMNLILLTVIDICNPAFIRENIMLANTIASMVDRYGEHGSSLDSNEDEE